ncbi:MAG: T9SS type A sorting domain-containing protein [Saprospiraceae bacterium]|nr:T9SS type A sorting domain-containing protein [Saprospiraceae bacterium]
MLKRLFTTASFLLFALCAFAQLPGPTGPLQGPGLVAPTTTITYSVQAVAGAEWYTWTFPVGATLNGQSSPVQIAAPFGNVVQIAFDYTAGSVCVTPGNSNGNGAPACLNVQMVFGDIPVCENPNQPAADDCKDACLFCPFDGYDGTTVGYTPDVGINGFCGVLHNDQWIGFVAGDSSVAITALATNCTNGNGIQMALYQNCGNDPIICHPGLAGGADIPLVLVSDMLIPGAKYLLMIDGWEGDQCNFSVTIDPPGSTVAPDLDPTPAIQGLDTVCVGATVTYTIPPVANAGSYFWSAPPGSLINGLPTPQNIELADGAMVTITFGNESGEVCVTPHNFCKVGDTRCLPVTVQEIPIVQLPTLYVCFEDAPFVWDNPPYPQYSGPGTITFTSDPLPSYLGCDSVVQQTVVLLPPIVKFLGVKYLCPGESLTVCGEEFNQAGSYSAVCESYLGCDSTNNFSLVYLNAVADIQTNSTQLDCNAQSLVLNSAPSSGLKQWFNEFGVLIGVGNTLTVNMPGTYILKTTANGGGSTCTATDTVSITSSAVFPLATATGGALTCTTTSVTLDGQALPSGASFSWTGPGGFTSTVEDPTVTIPGVYTLVVTHPTNGCTAYTTAVVEDDQDEPLLQTNDLTLTCSQPAASLSVTSTPSDVLLQWSGPNGFTSNTPNPETNTPGVYTVVATDPANNCTASATLTVSADATPPQVSATGGTLTCLIQNIQLTIATSADNPAFSWSGPQGFTSNEAEPLVDQPGTYFVIVTDTDNGCAASASAEVLANTNVPSVIAEGGLLTCSVQSIQLYVNTSAGNLAYAWTGPQNFSSTSAQPIINLPGAYSVVVTDTDNGCSTAVDLEIYSDTIAPDLTASGGTLTCSNPLIQLTALSKTPQALYEWTGPDNFTSGEQWPWVMIPGAYTVVVTNPNNGCTSEASVEVNFNTWPPVITLEGDTLNCLSPSTDISATSTAGNPVYAWSGPGGFSSDQPVITVNLPGLYSLTITDQSNGCSSAAEYLLLADPDSPALSTVSVTPDMNNQGTGAIDLDISGNSGPYLVVWSSNGVVVGNTEDLSGLTAGDYTAVVTGANGCTASLTVTVSNVSATAEPLSEAGWLLFPNPVSDLLQLRRTTPGSDPADIYLYDARGRLIVQHTATDSAQLNVSAQPSGLYLLLLRSEGRQFWAKVVVSR